MPQIPNCRNCGAPVNPDNNSCRYCRTFQDSKNPIDRIIKNKKVRTRGIYPFLILAGILVVLYVYGIAFDDFSETQLITITPLWFFLIIFGTYGYFSEKLLTLAVARGDDSISTSYRKWMAQFAKNHLFLTLILSVLLFPFNFLKFKNSLLIATIASLIWGILLLIFFQGIFPSL